MNTRIPAITRKLKVKKKKKQEKINHVEQTFKMYLDMNFGRQNAQISTMQI